MARFGLSRGMAVCRALAAAFAMVLALGIAGLHAETRGTVEGSEPPGHGRMVFRFEAPVGATARVTGGSVLVVSFSEPVRIAGERLAREMPAFVSVVRQDPDGMALRLALRQAVRVNVIEAGEQVFVDLLPPSWTGLVPGLPPEVIADLAARARRADMQVRDAQRRAAEAAPMMPVRFGRLPTLSRISIDPPPGVEVAMVQRDDQAIVSFSGLVRIDMPELRRNLPGTIRGVTAEQGRDNLDLYLDLEPGVTLRSFREDGAFVIDVPMAPAAPAAEAALPASGSPASASPSPAIASQPASAPTAAALGAAADQSVLQPPVTPPQAQPTAEAATVPNVEAPVVPRLIMAEAGLSIELPFVGRTAAAAFQRGTDLTLVFDTREELRPLPAPGLAGAASAFVTAIDTSRLGRVAVMRLSLAKERLVRLLPADNGWTLSIADTVAGAVAPLDVTRQTDAQGRPAVAINAADASGVYWLEDRAVGDRVAVATMFAPPSGVAKAHRLVEFTILPTIQGIAVVAAADDVRVRREAGAVLVTRDAGLAVSQVEATPAGPGTKAVIARGPWLDAQAGVTRDRWRALAQAAIAASPAQRHDARLALADFLLANRLAVEAKGVLVTMARDNEATAGDVPMVLRRAIVDIMLHRNASAAAQLSVREVADDPEVGLWRAVAEARLGRHAAALAGFRRGSAILDGYPEDLQALMLPLAVGAAAEARDFPTAEGWMQKLATLPPDLVRGGELAMLRARIDEGTGRTAHALEAYDRLAEEAERPIAVRARFRGTELALRTGKVTPEQALPLFETLAVTWRGDDIELRALSQMGAVYGQTGQFRRAFETARQADDLFPDHPLTRRLHDEAAARFEALFLEGRGDRLDRVETLALYYDFKEYTPVGRRGDELIRHLADRLIELDLIEQAADLLDYQVSNRLSGAARVVVATKLASLRLIGGKPQAALQILNQSRLPDMPAEVRRARLVLEAKALADLKRTDLAIEILDGETGPDMDRLRADIYWAGGRWRQAGETIERNLGDAWRNPTPLDAGQRQQVTRAAIAYVLGDEALGLDRLRTKYVAKMGESPDAPVFDFLTAPGASRSGSFRSLAGAVNADALANFFADYRRLYPSVATPLQPAAPAEPQLSPGTGAPAPAGTPGAGASQATPANAG